MAPVIKIITLILMRSNSINSCVLTVLAVTCKITTGTTYGNKDAVMSNAEEPSVDVSKHDQSDPEVTIPDNFLLCTTTIENSHRLTYNLPAAYHKATIKIRLNTG